MPNANFTFNIWRVNTDGTGLTPLTNATAPGADSVEPRWSPDGMSVLFESARRLDGTDAPSAHNTFNIWRVNPDGARLTPLTRVTFERAHCQNPRWSPDGSKIVFDSSGKLDGTDAPNLNLTTNIWRVNPHATGLAPLTNATAHWADSVAPSFSP